jgi:20S proteasome alpha/beta subunit
MSVAQGYPVVSQVIACLTRDGGVIGADSRITSAIGGVLRRDDIAKKVFVPKADISVAYGMSGDWGSISSVADALNENPKLYGHSYAAVQERVASAFLAEMRKWHPKPDWPKYNLEGLFIGQHKQKCCLAFMSHEHDFKPQLMGNRCLAVGSYHGLHHKLFAFIDSLGAPLNKDDACRLLCRVIRFSGEHDEGIGGPIQLAYINDYGAFTVPPTDVARFEADGSAEFEEMMK